MFKILITNINNLLINIYHTFLGVFDYYVPLNYDLIWLLDKKLLKVAFHIYPHKFSKLFLTRLFFTLKQIQDFKSLGDVKVVLMCLTNADDFKMLGHSFQMTKDTKVDQFIDFYLNFYINNAEHSSKIIFLEADIVVIKAYAGYKKGLNNNNIQKKNYSTVYKRISHITPLISKNTLKSKIAVFDIETISLDQLYPYAIGLYYFKNNKPIIKIFYIDVNLPLNVASFKIITEFCNYIKENLNGYTIFAHNFGGFDGVFLLTKLYNIFGDYKIIMDKFSKIISISIPKYRLNFRDSYRLLPLSLAQLCNVFDTKQKLEFDHNSVTLDLINTNKFKKELIEYLTVDIESLYNIMIKAQQLLFNYFNIDLTTTYSSSHLSSKLFRTHYLDVDGIPLLPKYVDTFVRKSYFGGPVEVYKTYGENLYHYDVNSLYPYVMRKDMPYEFIGVKTGNKLNLSEIFGFVYASIYIPKTETRPLLYIKDENGNNMSATGNIIGYFFSEELKAVKKYGYNVKVYVAYEFSKKKLFVNYVNDLYKYKSESTNDFKTLIKFLLNGLYGYFGRSLDRNVTEIINIDELSYIGTIYSISNILELDDNYIMITRDITPNKNISTAEYLKHINKANGIKNNILTNVAIASAITSYGRIEMMKYKRLETTIYHDTDSIITTKELPLNMINEKEIGKFKDENKDEKIKFGYFLAPKMYGYKKENGKEIIHTAGIPKNLINIKMLEDLFNGKTILIETIDFIKYMNLAKIYNKKREIKLNTLTTTLNKTPIYDKEGRIIEYKTINMGFNEKIKNIYKTIKTIIEQNKYKYIIK